MNDAWNRFEHTGSVRDYLDYVGQSKDQWNQRDSLDQVQARMGLNLEEKTKGMKDSYKDSCIDNCKDSYERKVESAHGTTDETDRNRTLFK